MLIMNITIFVGCQKSEITPTPKSPSIPAPPPAASVQTESPFSTNAEGWNLNGDFRNGGFMPARYSPTGGVTDGYIYAEDNVDGGTWYFAAPTGYLGDKKNYYDCTIMFSLFQKSAIKHQYTKADIIIKNGDKWMSYALSKYPDTSWTYYKVKINDQSGWIKGDLESGMPASKSYIDSVLSNVTGFFIRGEFESGPDLGGLDYLYIYDEKKAAKLK